MGVVVPLRRQEFDRFLDSFHIGLRADRVIIRHVRTRLVHSDYALAQAQIGGLLHFGRARIAALRTAME